MTNKRVGRGKGCEKGDADNSAAHFAIANVIAAHARGGLITQVGVIKQHGDIDR